ncbi:MAG: hypothetical protein U5R31_02215 [Acidimicrobiia bacterium]|nr:hypothetical protein [Acidimicrobiia bacterium]
MTGKVAQFGRGVLADVSAKLMDEFVTNLEDEVLGAPDDRAAAADADTAGSTGSVAASAAAGRGATEPGVHAEPASDVEAVDLLGTAGAPVAKRLVPVVGAVVAVVAFGYLLRRRRR